MADSFRMQARDSVTGNVVTWSAIAPDFSGSSYPGPNTPVSATISVLGRSRGTSGSGDAVGPAGATDNALVRYDGTTGKLLQNSLVTVSDTGSIAVPAGQTIGGRDLSADGTKLDKLIVDSAEFTSGTATGNVISTVYTVPASPSGSSRFRLDDVMFIVTQVPVGSGTLLVRLGTTSGGNEIVTDCLVNASTSLRQIVGGLQLSTLGSAMTAANGYRTILAAGSPIYLQLGLTGTFSTAAKIRVTYEGRLLAL